MITLVAALSTNNCIGINNDLPWRLIGELKHFKRVTEGKVVVMGRKTFESMGSRPLPNRRNIVISTTMEPCMGVELFGCLDELPSDLEDIVIIGGGEIYTQFINKADCLILTEVDLQVNGDVFFPAIDPNVWTIESKEHAVYWCKQRGFDVNCSHVVYIKR